MKNKNNDSLSANISHYQNVEYKHFDKFGNIKKMFQENALCRFLIKNELLDPNWINEKRGKILSLFLGHWANSRVVANLVTSAGKAAIASRINGAGSEALFDKIGWGTGATAAAAGDTALQAEKDASGATSTTHVVSSATCSRVTTSVTNDTAQMVGTATATGTIAITESGVFNAATAGTLLARQVFTAVNVVSGDSIQFTWKIQAS
jgi:hypothetical protein